MRRTSFFMNLLVILPVLLLMGLLIWIGADGRPGGREAGNPSASSSEAESRKVSGGESQGGEQAGQSGQDGQKTGGTWEDEIQSEKQPGQITAPKPVESQNPGQAAIQKPVQKPNQASGQKPKPELEPEPKGPAIHLLFGGDVYLSGQAVASYNKAGGISGILDAAYQAEIKKADVFMVNQGFPFSDRGIPAPNKTTAYRVSPDRINILKALGPGIVSIANDHVMDYGADSLVDTCKTLSSGRILAVGAGTDMGQAKKPATIGVNGKTVGFLGASSIYPDSDWVAGDNKPGVLSGHAPAMLLDETGKAAGLCDYLVVYMYWGTEQDEKPQEAQRALAKQLIDAGADLIVGCHSNAPQGIEYYKGRPIVYSLGGFLSDKSIPKTALLKVDVYPEDRMVRLTLIPGSSSAGFTKELTDPAQLHDFYQHIQSISFGAAVDENGRVRPR